MSPEVKQEPIAELIGLMDAPYEEMIGAGLDPNINPNLDARFSIFSNSKDDLYKALAVVIGEMWIEVRKGIESHPESRGLIESASFCLNGNDLINESTYLTEEQIKQIISKSDKPERVARSISIYIQATLINNFTFAELKSGESVEDPLKDEFYIAGKKLQDANLPNHAGREVSYDVSRLVSNGANTAVNAYQDFVTVAF